MSSKDNCEEHDNIEVMNHGKADKVIIIGQININSIRNEY